MATLAERSLNEDPIPSLGLGRESGSWGLLLIPILLCIGMLVFAVMSSALPAPAETPTSRSCASYAPRQAGSC